MTIAAIYGQLKNTILYRSIQRNDLSRIARGAKRFPMFFASTTWIAQFSAERAVEGSHSGKGEKDKRGRQTNGPANCKRGPDCAIGLRQDISVPPGVSWCAYQSALETARINVVAGVYPIPRPYRRKVAVSSRGRENRANSPRPAPFAPLSHENRFAIFQRTSVETNGRERERHTVPCRGSRIVCQRRKMQLGCEPRVCRSTTSGRDGRERKNIGVTETRIGIRVPLGRPPPFPIPLRAMISIRFWSQVLRQSGTHDWPAPRHARVRETVISQRVLIKRPPSFPPRNNDPSIRRYEYTAIY